MTSRTNWLILLVFSFAAYVFPSVAADRIVFRDPPVSSNSRVSERKCEEYTQGTTCKNSYNNIDPNVVEDAQRGEFPHLTFIATNASRQGLSVFVCVGSLISPRFVLTAGQCTRNPDLPISYVSLGNHNIDPTVIDETSSIVQVPIKAIHTHPGYQVPKRYNDIALLELVSDVPFNANIRPACLWTERELSEYDKALVATIDRTRDSQLRRKVIQKVSVTIKDDATCNISNWISRHWPHGMDGTQLCGQEATGSAPECKAIGGAPLQIVLNKQNSCEFQVIGLTSFGFRNCVEYPTIFTRVSSFVDWMESIVWPGE